MKKTFAAIVLTAAIITLITIGVSLIAGLVVWTSRSAWVFVSGGFRMDVPFNVIIGTWLFIPTLVSITAFVGNWAYGVLIEEEQKNLEGQKALKSDK
jgi:heme/copper-type cytochrome/quinol oxidase subunit 2